MSDLHPKYIVKNQALFQEIVNEENAEMAKDDPEFAAKLAAINSALDTLTEAGIETYMYCEIHYPNNEGEVTPFVQYNNGVRLSEDPSSKESMLKAQQSWWKFAYASAISFAHLHIDETSPKWMNGLKVMKYLLSHPYYTWRDMKEKELNEIFDKEE